eukprot:TRINITY_DN12279_c0_g1_i1.p1 TRINITY_DN12279_c0_g1~~TRINITY_DN12279_c0_g1_i1.p1  ORF type:complete len:204 (-),score=4.89 TRINITY_DN12279_c0_g1_i1:149-760(-)
MKCQTSLLRNFKKHVSYQKRRTQLTSQIKKGRRTCVDCKAQAFMEGLFSQPNPEKNPKETITFFTADGMVQLHSQGQFDNLSCQKVQNRYDQLPTLDEQGLCIGATFQLSATNGKDPARRIQVWGFCRCVDYLSDVVGDTVISKGGEVMLCTTELKHGVSESLKMMVAIPFLWGIPPELDTLRQAIAFGGGIVHKEQKLWQIY